MEFVGKTVKKVFKRFGLFKGLVKSYDPSSGFYKIVYEDGDSEELDSSEVATLMDTKESDHKRRVKRRRRFSEMEAGNSNFPETLNSANTLVEVFDRDVDGSEGFDGNLRRINVDLNESLAKGIDHLRDNLCFKESIDLNQGFDLNLNEGFDFKDDDCLNGREYIDLNLDVNDHVDQELRAVDSNENSFETQKTECGFDLNRGIDEDFKDGLDGDRGVQGNESASCELVDEETRRIEEAIANGRLEEVHVLYDASAGLASEACREDIVSGKDFRVSVSVEVLDLFAGKEDQSEIIDANQADLRIEIDKANGSRRRGRRKLVGQPETKSANDFGYENKCTTTAEEQSCMGSAYKEVSSSYGKRRKVMGSASLRSETMLLRRSSRRGPIKNDVYSRETTSIDNDPTVSPEASELTEEKADKVQSTSLKEFDLPVKVQLPLSSKNLDLDGIPIFDLFAVYSCLRSFSTVLFLSPFELEDFVASLKCNFPTYLLDSVHVSILQTLRKHLEYLSDEGSESASDCLRSLDWGLLDLITWPIFMVEYILIHLPYLKPSFDVSSLKLLKGDYHKQAASIKVEILRCLCDAMMEVEVIRFELNRRSFGAEADIDFDMNVSIRSNRKRRVSVDVRNNSCLTEDIAESFCDWNSDECCLCKMDGILICCDGCPAAYHSKCVGVANDLLPEGDWYCPECVVDRNNPWMKSLKSVRGAELLGIDPYGRRYFCSCGYLLVFDSCENKNAFNFYHTDSLDDVIEVLKSSEVLYGDILDTICKQWKIPGCLHRKDGNLDFQICNSSVAACVPTSGLVASVKYGVQNEILDESEPKEKIAGSSDHLNAELSKSVSAPYMSSEETVETIVASTELNTQIEGQDHCNKSAERPVKPLTDHSLSNTLDVIQENNITAAAIADTSLSVKAEGINRMHAQAGNGYNNYYGFGRTAFAVVEELLNKSSARASEQSLKTEEEIISTQLKAISKKYLKFEWPNFMSYNTAAQKEKCGWCFPCRAPTDDSKCLFHADLGHLQKGCLNDIISLQSKRNNRGHLVDVASYVLMIEHRLHGLLLGPWIKPHHTRLWRKNILKASDISSVKRLLLELELSMHHLALSPEWFNPLDATTTMGSATHVITAFSRASSKNATGRKKSRHSELEASPLSNSSGGLGMLWWRGGRLSRKIFSWKVLPHSSVSKAARQAGCTKIPGIFYSENSDFAKRIKYIIWRAAVEESTTAEQLALQVRELDAHIKWDEIENTCRLSILDKGLKKSARLFKKVIVRRKSTDGVGAKYLLDFGKRKAIPEVVLKRGLRVEESSSERKKYWLNESYVPLYLLKSFEEKRIVRKSSKINSVELSEVGVAPKRSLKNTGFDYLFAKAERSEHYQCGHCNKNVPIREAVGCQYCQGFFHKRHVKKSCNSVIADCTYTCHRCLNGKYVQVDKKVGRRGPGRGKNGVRIGGPGRGKIGVRVGGPGRGKKGVRIGGPGRGKKGVRVGRPGRENSGVSTGKSTTKIVNGPHIKTKRETAQRISMQLSKGRKSLRISRPQQSKRNEEVSAVMPLRRSSRKAQQSLPLTEKVEPLQKRKQEKLGKDTPKIAKECISWRKKRTQVYQSYWLNGLQLSLKPNDDRAIHFKRKCFLAPNESTIPDRPKCQLCCEVGYQSTSSYISCEICGEWFHGDAFGIKVDSISKLIGFRCHICRKASPPVCQNMPVAEGHVSESKHDDVEQDLPCVNENTETRVSELGDAIGIVDLSQSHKGIAKQPKAPNTRKRRLRGSATELDAVAINTVDTDRGQEEVLKESEGPITRRRRLRGSYSYTHLKGAQ